MSKLSYIQRKITNLLSPSLDSQRLNNRQGAKKTSENAPFKVISFYTTHNEYAELAAKLKNSLDKFDIAYEIVPLRSAGSWEANCAIKAKFIQEKWHSSDVPIIWLDADATLEKEPSLFTQINCDFAVHKWEGWSFGSGTLYFGKTPLAIKLINQWVYRCEADPLTWDQTHLQSAWCDISSVEELRTYWLPRSYLQIFDRPSEEDAVIVHWQASRNARRKGHKSARQFIVTEEGKRKRHDNELWRTREEAFWILEGTKHIKPEIGYKFPEGFDVRGFLKEAIGTQFPVLEIGCGVGRIASLFRPSEYLGIDVNPAAIKQARQTLPKHEFRLIDDGIAYPEAKAALLYTVLLHVSDEAIEYTLRNIADCTDTIIIAELMDERWRREGNPPVFNRNPEGYIILMDKLGYKPVKQIRKTYERYNVEPWKNNHDVNITALTFQRKT